MGFQLVPKSLTLNGIVAVTLRYYTECSALAFKTNFVKLVEAGPCCL